MSRMRVAGDPPYDKKLGALTGMGVTDAPEAERLIAAIWLLSAQIEALKAETAEVTRLVLERAKAEG